MTRIATFAVLFALTLCGTAEAKRRPLTIGTPTNYGAAVINGVYTTFVCTTSCTVTSPDWLKGRTVVHTASGWVLL